MGGNGWLAWAGLVLAAFVSWATSGATTTERSLLSVAQAAAVHGGLPASSTAPKCTLKRLKVSCPTDSPCAQSIDDAKNKCGGACKTVCKTDQVYYHVYDSPDKKWKKDGDNVTFAYCGVIVTGNFTCAVKGTVCVCNGNGRDSTDPCLRETPAHNLCD